jgi:hypothetical protein
MPKPLPRSIHATPPVHVQGVTPVSRTFTSAVNRTWRGLRGSHG